MVLGDCRIGTRDLYMVGKTIGNERSWVFFFLFLDASAPSSFATEKEFSFLRADALLLSFFGPLGFFVSRSALGLGGFWTF